MDRLDLQKRGWLSSFWMAWMVRPSSVASVICMARVWPVSICANSPRKSKEFTSERTVPIGWRVLFHPCEHLIALQVLSDPGVRLLIQVAASD